MEPWRAVEAHNGGVEAQNKARKVPVGVEPVLADSYHFDDEQDTDPVPR
jgi:hypothetical protein